MWILVVVLSLGLNGTNVKFQSFPDDHSCALARIVILDRINKHGGGHGYDAFCLDQNTGRLLSENAFTINK